MQPKPACNSQSSSLRPPPPSIPGITGLHHHAQPIMSFTERKAQMMNRTQLSYLFGLLNFEPTPQAFLVFRERCLCLRRVLRLRRAPPRLAMPSFRRKISFLTSAVPFFCSRLLSQACLVFPRDSCYLGNKLPRVQPNHGNKACSSPSFPPRSV